MRLAVLREHYGLGLCAEPGHAAPPWPAAAFPALPALPGHLGVPEHGHFHEVPAKAVQLELYVAPQVHVVLAVADDAAPVAAHDRSCAPRPVAAPKAVARVDHHDGHRRGVQPRVDRAPQGRRDRRGLGQVVPEHLDVAPVLELPAGRQEREGAGRRGRHGASGDRQKLVPRGLAPLGHVRLFPDERKAPLARAALGGGEAGAPARGDQLVPRRAERQDARPAHVVLALDEPDRVLVAPLQREERDLKVLRPLPLPAVGHRNVRPLPRAVGHDHYVARHLVGLLRGQGVKVAAPDPEVLFDGPAHRARGAAPLGVGAGEPAGL